MQLTIFIKFEEKKFLKCKRFKANNNLIKIMKMTNLITKSKQH